MNTLGNGSGSPIPQLAPGQYIAPPTPQGHVPSVPVSVGFTPRLVGGFVLGQQQQTPIQQTQFQTPIQQATGPQMRQSLFPAKNVPNAYAGSAANPMPRTLGRQLRALVARFFPPKAYP